MGQGSAGGATGSVTALEIVEPVSSIPLHRVSI